MAAPTGPLKQQGSFQMGGLLKGPSQSIYSQLNAGNMNLFDMSTITRPNPQKNVIQEDQPFVADVLA